MRRRAWSRRRSSSRVSPEVTTAACGVFRGAARGAAGCASCDLSASSDAAAAEHTCPSRLWMRRTNGKWPEDPLSRSFVSFVSSSEFSPTGLFKISCAGRAMKRPFAQLAAKALIDGVRFDEVFAAPCSQRLVVMASASPSSGRVRAPRAAIPLQNERERSAAGKRYPRRDFAAYVATRMHEPGHRLPPAWSARLRDVSGRRRDCGQASRLLRSCMARKTFPT